MNVADIIKNYTAQNETNNSSSIQAEVWAQAMSDLGLPFDGIQAMATGQASGPADVLTLDQVIAAGVPSSVQLNFVGYVNEPGPMDADGTKGDPYRRTFNIGLQRIAAKQGGYVFLYCERHGAGTTPEKAYEAAIELPMTHSHIAQLLAARITGALTV